jgi:hypothetical protein
VPDLGLVSSWSALTDLRDHILERLEELVLRALALELDGPGDTKDLRSEPEHVELVGDLYTFSSRFAFTLRVWFDARDEPRFLLRADPLGRESMDEVELKGVERIEWRHSVEGSLADVGIVLPARRDHSLRARLLRRLAHEGAHRHPCLARSLEELERTVGAPVPPLLGVFFTEHAQGGVGPFEGTLSLTYRRAGSVWAALERARDAPWIPAFEVGRGEILLVNALEPEGSLLLEGRHGSRRLTLTLPELLEAWLADTLDRHALA